VYSNSITPDAQKESARAVEWILRRILASLLVALFSFSLIAPAVLPSDANFKLPACCRRDGKHRCGTASPSETSSSPTLHAARCAFFPSVPAIPASQFAGLPETARAAAVVFFSHSASISKTQAQSRISYSQAGHKRGPPALFS
jgi:hypothetical protein